MCKYGICGTFRKIGENNLHQKFMACCLCFVNDKWILGDFKYEYIGDAEIKKSDVILWSCSTMRKITWETRIKTTLVQKNKRARIFFAIQTPPIDCQNFVAHADNTARWLLTNFKR